MEWKTSRNATEAIPLNSGCAHNTSFTERLTYLNTFGFIVTPARLVSSNSSNSSALSIFFPATLLDTLCTFAADAEDITQLIYNHSSAKNYHIQFYSDSEPVKLIIAHNSSDSIEIREVLNNKRRNRK